MVNVTAVGVERTLSVENAAEEGKDRVTERYREREQRNQECDDGMELEQAHDGDAGEDEAEADIEDAADEEAEDQDGQ